MSEQNKRLSDEELNYDFNELLSFTPSLACKVNAKERLRGHITALESEITQLMEKCVAKEFEVYGLNRATQTLRSALMGVKRAFSTGAMRAIADQALNDSTNPTEIERWDESSYHRVMHLLRATKMPHGLCHPRERKACTACNAQDKLDQLIAEYKGEPIHAQLTGEKK